MADLDFNKLLKRGDDKFRGRDKQMPSELFQCVVFFSRPVSDEVEELRRVKELETMKGFSLIFGSNLKKVIQDINSGVENQRFVFPFYSKEVFFSRQEAEKFLPLFIKQLIKETKLPSEVINADTSVNEDMVTLGVAPLIVTLIEQERDEFKS